MKLLIYLNRISKLILYILFNKETSIFLIEQKTAVNCAKRQNIPIVIDADGLFILSYDTSLVKGYEKCILTPNVMEFKRIYENEVDFLSLFVDIINISN